MILIPNLHEILFLDAETAPQYKSYDDMPERMQKLWDKKFDAVRKIEGYDESVTSREKYYDRNVFAEFNKTVCLTVGMLYDKNTKLKVKSFYGHDEKKLLIDFIELLKKPEIKTLCAHNGKEFDFPLLCKRMIIHGIHIPPILQISGKKPWEISLLDTKEMWKFGSYKDSVSLDLLAAVLGIPSPKDELKGADVAKAYWIEDRIEDIKNYCERDVKTLANIALRISGNEIVSDENIEFA